MRNTRTKFLSILLTLCMVLTLLPMTAFADYEDGEECYFCGHYHWDEYMCSCGGCSEDCSESDCYEACHCEGCGECLVNLHDTEYCEVCEKCKNCWEEENHCCECGVYD